METKTCKCGQVFETNTDGEQCINCYQNSLPTPFDMVTTKILLAHGQIGNWKLRQDIKNALLEAYCAGGLS